METELGTIFSPKQYSPQIQKHATKPTKNKKHLWTRVALIAIAVFLLFYVIGLKMIKDKPNDQVVKEQIAHKESGMVENREFDNPVLGKYLYTGKVDENGIPHGRGIANFMDNGKPNGNMYEGPFVHGVFSGDNAIFKYGNENTFKGSFENNMYSKGKLIINSNGQYFEGSFSNGDPYNGTWYDSNGETITKLTNGK